MRTGKTDKRVFLQLGGRAKTVFSGLSKRGSEEIGARGLPQSLQQPLPTPSCPCFPHCLAHGLPALLPPSPHPPRAPPTLPAALFPSAPQPPFHPPRFPLLPHSHLGHRRRWSAPRWLSRCRRGSRRTWAGDPWLRGRRGARSEAMREPLRLGSARPGSAKAALSSIWPPIKKIIINNNNK